MKFKDQLQKYKNETAKVILVVEEKGQRMLERAFKRLGGGSDEPESAPEEDRPTF